MALTIAGSDALSAGGMQTDLNTFFYHEVYGLVAVTSLVCTGKSTIEVNAVAPSVLSMQLDAISRAVSVDAIKIGLLPSAKSVYAVEDFLDSLADRDSSSFRFPEVVLDPVFALKEDEAFCDTEVIEAVCDRLIKYATIITPNLLEYRILEEYVDPEDLENKFILTKNTDPDSTIAVDVLMRGETTISEYKYPMIPGKITNGAGCMLSAAVTANLALGLEPEVAIVKSREHVQSAIDGALAFDKLNKNRSDEESKFGSVWRRA
jgi:hydroxymethylpyrimidine/phosphomethylpyrimidine kinase